MTHAMDNSEPLEKREAFFSGSDDPALESAHHETSVQQKFWERSKKSLKKEDVKLVDDVMLSYESEHTLAGLEGLLARYLPATEAQVDKLYERREKGRKKASADVQRFANTFAEFLQCYSPVLELVKTADNQFGGVAVQTLSLLLVVAVNKSEKEDLIESSLVTIKNNFPRLQGFRTIYPTRKMQELVAQAYRDVLVFAQKAIEYYKRSAWRRVWEAISDPPQVGVQIAVNKILGDLAEVQNEAQYLLNDKVNNLERRISDMQKEVQGVQRGVGHLEQQHSENLLSSLQERLLAGQFSCTDQLKDYRGQLEARFHRNKSTKFGLGDIVNHAAYQSWNESKKTNTLVIHGHTRVRNTALSWLSQAAVDLVDALKHEALSSRTTAKAVVWYFCKREGMMDEDHMHMTLSRLVYQLLHARPSILDNDTTYNFYNSQLESTSWKKRQLQSACKMLTNTMCAFETVYVVLDRPEMCTGGKGGMPKLLEMLRQIQGVIVKTFIVVDADEADEADLREWVDAAGADGLQIIRELDQEY